MTGQGPVKNPAAGVRIIRGGSRCAPVALRPRCEAAARARGRRPGERGQQLDRAHAQLGRHDRSSATTTIASGSTRSSRQWPAAGGTRSATIASQVAIAGEPGSSSSPSWRAASGSRSPTRAGRRRRARPGRPSPCQPSRRSRDVSPAAISTDQVVPTERRPGRGRRGWSWSRTPAAAPRSGGRGARGAPGPAREHVVEQEQRRPTVEGGQQVELGELEGGIAVRC